MIQRPNSDAILGSSEPEAQECCWCSIVRHRDLTDFPAMPCSGNLNPQSYFLFSYVLLSHEKQSAYPIVFGTSSPLQWILYYTSHFVYTKLCLPWCFILMVIINVTACTASSVQFFLQSASQIIQYNKKYRNKLILPSNQIYLNNKSQIHFNSFYFQIPLLK